MSTDPPRNLEVNPELEQVLKKIGLGIWEIWIHNDRIIRRFEWGHRFRDDHKTWSDCVNPQDVPRIVQIYREATEQIGQTFEVEYRVQLEDGEHWFFDQGHILEIDERRGIIKVAGINQDISRRKHLENSLRDEARVDPLTGLGNRRMLDLRFDESRIRSIQEHREMALLFLDIDGFKSINDEYGHDCGDDCLRAIASRIMDCVREHDCVARVGGDEFVVLLPESVNRDLIERICTRILDAIAHPFPAVADRHQPGVSIGISIFPDDGTAIDELLQKADRSMYQVKQQGKNSYQWNK